jgi:hypothetical protein
MFATALNAPIAPALATALGASVMVVVIVALLVGIIATVIWVGRDARTRGFRPVWALQLLMCLQFPWVFLTYMLITRNMDRLAVAAT